MRGGHQGRGRGGYNNNQNNNNFYGGNANNNNNNNNNNNQRNTNSNVPSETLRIRVSEIRQPVTEEVMRRVFGSVGVSSRRVDIQPSNNPNETIVVVDFADTFSASRVMESLSGRNIFNDGNKMTMSYEQPRPAAVAAAPAVLPSPGMSQQMYNPMQQQQQPQPVYQQPPTVMVGQQSIPSPMFGQPFPGQGMMPTPLPDMMGGFMPNPAMGAGAAGSMMMMPPPQQQMQMQMQQPQQQQGGAIPFNTGGRGFRGGRGRGGRGGSQNNGGFNPMGPGPAGSMAFPGAMMGFPGSASQMPVMGAQNGAGPFNKQNSSTVYLSVTAMPESEPLQTIFVLLEAFGGVVTIRRNQKKKEILTVKMASTDDAEAVVRFLRRTPYSGGFVSAKKFPSYVERNPCTDEGDANDPVTAQFDFTASRHRSPGQRSKCAASNTLKVTGCAGYCEAELMAYFNGKGFFPERISKDEDGAFTVQVTDIETAVKLLINCHGDVCREERSNVLFIEDPKAREAEAAEAA